MSRHIARRERLKSEARFTGDTLSRARIDLLLSHMEYNPVSGCLEWQNNTSGDGYPEVVWRGKKYQVYRLMWEWLHSQPVPDDHDIDHTCNNRRCCLHLEAVTHAENVRRIHNRDTLPLLTWRDIRDARAREQHLDAIAREDIT